MFQRLISLILVGVIYGLPMDIIVKSVSESTEFDNFDNYIPRYDNIPNFGDHNLSHSFMETDTLNVSSSENNFNDGFLATTAFSERTIRDDDAKIIENYSTERSESKKGVPFVFTNSSEKQNMKNIVTTEKNITGINSTFNISDVDISFNETSRNPREETEKDDPEFAENDSKELSEEDEEEDMNMVTGILSALLGGLSKPDGSIDLEAIVGLIGSLSSLNDDGTYDFSGLTELLRGFFGGAGDGGSDVGAFLGGLIGAVIKGIANPPGGKGVGILAAKLVAGILPALSVQPPDPDIMSGKPGAKPGGLDIGGFLSGFLKTFLAASTGGDVNPIQFVISTISSLSNSKYQTERRSKNKSFTGNLK